VSVKRRPNPFSDQYTAMIDHIVGQPAFVELVKSNNVWRFDKPVTDQGWMHEQDADTPSVRFFPAGAASDTPGSSTGSRHSLTVQIEIATYTLDSRPMFSVYWAIIEAMNRATDGVLPGATAVSVDSQAAIVDYENQQVNNGVVGWSMVLSVTSQFWTDRETVGEGGY